MKDLKKISESWHHKEFIDVIVKTHQGELKDVLIVDLYTNTSNKKYEFGFSATLIDYRNHYRWMSFNQYVEKYK